MHQNHRCLLHLFIHIPCNSVLKQHGHVYLGSCSAGSLVYSCLCLAVGCVDARLGSLLALHAASPSDADVHDFTMHCARLCSAAMQTGLVKAACATSPNLMSSHALQRLQQQCQQIWTFCSLQLHGFIAIYMHATRHVAGPPWSMHMRKHHKL